MADTTKKDDSLYSSELSKEEQTTLLLSENRERIQNMIRDLTLFDDILMSRVFEKNISATELLLRIVLDDESIKVLSSTGQQEMKGNVGDRTIRLDIHAVSGDGRHFDVEIQKNKEGSHVRRARYHSSMIDTKMLKEGQKFQDLNDSYVIFICEEDKFGKNIPIYHVERVIYESRESFDDGSHIIYVNGEYDSDDSVGKLIHDLKCKESEDMYFKELAEQMIKDTFKTMILDGISVEKARLYSRISKEAEKEVLESLEVTV